MKKLLTYSFLLLALISLPSCSPADETPLIPETPALPDNSPQEDDPQTDSNNNENSHMESNTLKLTVNGHSFTATLIDNPSTQALKARLAEGDINIRMSDYGDMEKVGSLGFTLPRNDVPTTTAPGDMVLYQGNSLVIFYGTNSWSYTRLGKIDEVSNREQMLERWGETGTVTVTLSLAEE